MPRRRKNDGAQPTRVAPGGDYGDRQQLEQMQQVQPLPDRQEQLAAAMAAAQQVRPTGGLTAPTERPNEPLSAGLSVGPGAGPSQRNIAAPEPQNPDAKLMAAWLPVLETLANSPTASATTRNWVRKMRSGMPADLDFTQVV